MILPTRDQLSRLHRDVYLAGKHLAELSRDFTFISDVLYDLLADLPVVVVASKLSGEVVGDPAQRELFLDEKGRENKGGNHKFQGSKESN